MRSYIYWVKRGLVLAGTISMIPAGIGMSHERDWNAYQDSSIRSEQQVKSKAVQSSPSRRHGGASVGSDGGNQRHGNTTMENRRVRRGGRGNTHSIIFVGGKKTGEGSSRCCRSRATKSNPRQAKKTQGELNPQPIPPGKQRQPE